MHGGWLDVDTATGTAGDQARTFVPTGMNGVLVYGMQFDKTVAADQMSLKNSAGTVLAKLQNTTAAAETLSEFFPEPIKVLGNITINASAKVWRVYYQVH